MVILTIGYLRPIIIHLKIVRDYVRKEFRFNVFLKKPQDYVEGPVTIYLRITVDGVPKEMSTKRLWDPGRWNVKANRAIGNKEEVRNLNAYLDILQNKAYEARTHLINRGKVVTSQAIKNIISGEDQRQWMLLSLFKKHNQLLAEMIGNGVAKGTHTNFETSYKHLAIFGRSHIIRILIFYL